MTHFEYHVKLNIGQKCQSTFRGIWMTPHFKSEIAYFTITIEILICINISIITGNETNQILCNGFQYIFYTACISFKLPNGLWQMLLAHTQYVYRSLPKGWTTECCGFISWATINHISISSRKTLIWSIGEMNEGVKIEYFHMIYRKGKRGNAIVLVYCVWLRFPRFSFE